MTLRRYQFVFPALVLLMPIALADDLTREVQEQLRGKGFYAGPLDGNAGSEFTAALRRYQIRHGLPVTGVLDVATAEVLDDENGSLRSSGLQASPDSSKPVFRGDAVDNSPPPEATPASSPAAGGGPIPLPSSVETPAFEGSPGLTNERVQKFIAEYLSAGGSNNIDAQMRYFAFPVEYFEHGRVNEEFVRKDTAGYVRRWPARHYMLTDPVKVTLTSVDTATAEFIIAFSVQKGNRRASGRTSNRVLVRDANGTLQIIGIRERRLDI